MELKPDIIQSISDLDDKDCGIPNRADFYYGLSHEFKIAILNDEDFDTFVDANTKRREGSEFGALIIENEGTRGVLCIRASQIIKL